MLKTSLLREKIALRGTKVGNAIRRPACDSLQFAVAGQILDYTTRTKYVLKIGHK